MPEDYFIKGIGCTLWICKWLTLQIKTKYNEKH